MDDRTRGFRRLGVFGGTFDPIHVGHLVAASEVLHAFELDRILFVPAAAPWQKSSYAPAEDRLLMVTLGAALHPRFAVSRMELDRRGPSYTIDTLELLRSSEGGETVVHFIVGADALLNISTWHRVAELRSLARFIGVARPGFDLQGFSPDPAWPEVDLLQIPGIDVSGTDIRNRVRIGKPIDFLVPSQVASYIAETGLYRDSQPFADAS